MRKITNMGQMWTHMGHTDTEADRLYQKTIYSSCFWYLYELLLCVSDDTHI